MMKIAEVIQCVRENVSLIPKDYFLFEEDGYLGYPLILIKETPKFIFRLGLWIDNECRGTEFNSTIYFKQVEDVLKPLLLKNKIINNYCAYSSSTIWLKRIEPNLFHKTLHPGYPKTIGTKLDVLNLFNDLHEYTISVAEPFFQKWADLRVLNNFIANVPQTEVPKYLGNYGGFSKLLIYKLCCNPKFEDELKSYFSHYINQSLMQLDTRVIFRQKQAFMRAYKMLLARIKPIYNLA
jgi:hypothetical protein